MSEAFITDIFCEVDDFVQIFETSCDLHALRGPNARHRQSRMSRSEQLTLLILFHFSGYRTFKHFYLGHVSKYWRGLFPSLLSCTRFLGQLSQALVPLTCLLPTLFGTPTGIAYIDSTKLAVCHPKRNTFSQSVSRHRQTGKTSMGWFYGFKLHVIIHEHGELLSVHLTAGNVDDRVPVKSMTHDLWGVLFGDKGYISQDLFQTLYDQGLTFITYIRANMKNRLLLFAEKLLLKKRSLVESVFGQLKNVFLLSNILAIAVLAAFAFISWRDSLLIV